MKWLKRILISSTFAVILSVLLVGVVLATTFTAYITILNTSVTSYTNIPLSVSSNNTYLAANGYISTNGTDVQLYQGSTALKRMMISDKTYFVLPSLSALGSASVVYTTNNTPVGFPLILGNGGYFMVNDNITLEPVNNYSLELNDAYITTSSTSANVCTHFDPTNGGLVTKTLSGYLYNQIWASSSTLQFTALNLDKVTIPDSPGFTFSSGGHDIPFSVSFWTRPTSLSSMVYISKYSTAAGNQREWFIQGLNVSGRIDVQLWDNVSGANIEVATVGGITNAVWTYVTVTYDGSETVAGIKIYYNGVLQSSTGIITGAYTSMANTTSDLLLGAIDASFYLNGKLSMVQIYRNIALTQTQVTQNYLGYIPATLEAKYTLFDGAGNPADTSGNGHNATANLADWIAEMPPVAASVVSVALTGAEHDIIFSLSGGNNGISIDGVSTTIAYAGSIPNSTANWYFLDSAYIGNAKYYVSGIQQLYYEIGSMNIISGTTLPNLGTFGATGNGVITWGTNPSGISTSISGFTFSSTTTSSTSISTPNVVGTAGSGIPQIHRPNTDLTMPGNELYPTVNTIATIANIPIVMIWWFGSFICVIVVLGVVKKYSNSIFAAGIMAVVVMGVFCVLGASPSVPNSGGCLEWWEPASVLLAVITQVVVDRTYMM